MRESARSKKKKSLSRLIGPPMLPPNWLRISGVRGMPLRLLNQSLATVVVSRWYSLMLPWNLIGSVLGHELKLTAAAGADAETSPATVPRELLDRVDGSVGDVSKGLCRRDVVYVQAVHRDRGLVDACARDRALKGIDSRLLVNRGRDSARAVIDRQFIELLDVDVVADGGVGGIQRHVGVGGGDHNRLDTAGRQYRILGTRDAHAQSHVGDLGFRKALAAEGEPVTAIRRSRR